MDWTNIESYIPKTEQRFIFDAYPSTFSNEVNKYLKDGWAVVPETLKIVVTRLHDNGVSQCFAVVVEKPLTK